MSLLGENPEIFILKIIQNHENSILNDFQFGFRRSFSTTHVPMALADNVSLGFKNRNATIVTSLDIEKTFDSVC